MAKQDEYVRYTIRVPQATYAALEQAAHDANRSTNAEIVERLKHAVAYPPDAVAQLKKQIESLDDELNLMEGDLRQQADELTASEAKVEVLKRIVASNSAFTTKLMYHVLNYIDEIPKELAIWSFDIICLFDRNADPESEGKTDATLAEIKAAKESYQNISMERIRKAIRRLSLQVGDLDTAEKKEEGEGN